jgi:hypothetical protein
MGAVPPDLPEHPAGDDDGGAGVQSGTHEATDAPTAPIEVDQGAGIDYEAEHAARPCHVLLRQRAELLVHLVEDSEQLVVLHLLGQRLAHVGADRRGPPSANLSLHVCHELLRNRHGDLALHTFLLPG